MKKVLIAAITVAALAGVGTPAALADGPCGANYSIQTACPLSGPGTYNGTVVTNTQNMDFSGGGENDYYKFSATPGTVLSVTINDNYACNVAVLSTAAGQCGELSASLPVSNDDTIVSTPAGYMVGPDGMTFVLQPGTLNAGPLGGTANGGYYVLEVDGTPAFTQNTDNTLSIFPTPYSISVAVTAGSISAPSTSTPQPPAPPPTPPTPPTTPAAPVHHPAAVVRCVVPRFSGQALSAVKHRLAANHCTVGRVQWFTKVPHRFGRPRHGNVFAVVSGTRKTMKAGATLPKGTALGVWVAGPKLAQTRSR